MGGMVTVHLERLGFASWDIDGVMLINFETADHKVLSQKERRSTLNLYKRYFLYPNIKNYWFIAQLRTLGYIGSDLLCTEPQRRRVPNLSLAKQILEQTTPDRVAFDYKYTNFML